MGSMTLTGGAALQKKLNSLARALSKPVGVEIGFPSGGTYPDGTSIPMVAAIQEYGAPSRGIPPRPFMRRTIAEHGNEWGGNVETLLVANDFDGARTMGQMGQLIAGQIKATIVDVTTPPLAPETVRRKKSAKPLVDTGVMLGAVQYQVK